MNNQQDTHSMPRHTKLRYYIEDPLRKAGIAVATGSLILSMTPAAFALAKNSSKTNSASIFQAAGSDTSSDASSTTSDTPPDMPSGEAPGGGMGSAAALGGGGGMGSAAALGGGGMGSAAAPDGGGGGSTGGANTTTFDYTGTYTAALSADGETVESSDETYEATDSDQNAALVENGGTLTITGDTLKKSGDDTNGDNCNFYGLNSILLAVGEGSLATVSDTSLSASSEGSNGIFATDSGTVYASGVTINTTAGNSRGLDATYAGTIVAHDVTIDTQGDHCAAFATDRGGGYISVTDSQISTAGSGSPLLYSTGDIEVSNITGTSTGSQIAGMEGLNTILINNSTLTSTLTGATASDPVADAIIIYQSTSGDAESTTGDTATFQVVGSTLSSSIESGSFFYLTNTSASILVERTSLEFDSDAACLLYAAGNDANSWGSAGSNGASVTFTAREQTLSGNIVADTISSADVYLLDSTTWTGAASIEENTSGSTSDTPLSINICSESTWVVTADSTVSFLSVAEGGQVIDKDGNAVTIVAAGDTVSEGSSDITVTVNDEYTTTLDDSAAATVLTSDAMIDRSDFDSTFGTTTSFSMGDTTKTDSSDTTAASEGSSSDSSSSEDSGGSWWDAIVNWFRNLFGLN